MLKFILDRAKERSTWIGLIAVAGVVGVKIDAAAVDQVVQIAGGVAGLLAIVWPDKKAAA